MSKSKITRKQAAVAAALVAGAVIGFTVVRVRAARAERSIGA